MRMGHWSIAGVAVLGLALAGCGEAASDVAAPIVGKSAAPSATASLTGEQLTVLAFGDSLFAGFGLAEKEGYPEQLQAALQGQGLNVHVVDAGVSGDTTGAGAQRIAFVLDGMKDAPDLALVQLGGNDFLRGLPVADARKNLETILSALKERGIPVLLFGMRAPPNLGADYVAGFDAMYGELAAEYGAQMVPFWLEPVYDQPQLMQGDRVHPTAEGIAALVDYTEDNVRAALAR